MFLNIQGYFEHCLHFDILHDTFAADDVERFALDRSLMNDGGKPILFLLFKTLVPAKALVIHILLDELSKQGLRLRDARDLLWLSSILLAVVLVQEIFGQQDILLKLSKVDEAEKRVNNLGIQLLVAVQIFLECGVECLNLLVGELL